MPNPLLETSISPLAFGAVGDAYGFCFEFADENHVQQHNFLSYVQHPEFVDVRPGAYSDDTQMQLALAEMMASGIAWTKRNIAASFVETFKRDPRKGYAKRFHTLLEQVSDGDDLLRNIVPRSERNGAAMRAPILGLYEDEKRVIEHARIQAEITHDTAGGTDAAIASALISHFFVHQLGNKTELPKYLKKRLPDYDWEKQWLGSVPCHGISTILAVLTTILNTSSLGEILRTAIEFTGDVDSVATIAMACASSSPEFQRDLPSCLIDDFENSEYGLPFLMSVDRSVLQKLNL